MQAFESLITVLPHRPELAKKLLRMIYDEMSIISGTQPSTKNISAKEPPLFQLKTKFIDVCQQIDDYNIIIGNKLRK